MQVRVAQQEDTCPPDTALLPALGASCRKMVTPAPKTYLLSRCCMHIWLHAACRVAWASGEACVLMAACIFSIIALCVKLLHGAVLVFQIVLVRR